MTHPIRALFDADDAFGEAVRAQFGDDRNARYQPHRWGKAVREAWAKVEALRVPAFDLLRGNVAQEVRS
jgi:hypothetical protein